MNRVWHILEGFCLGETLRTKTTIQDIVVYVWSVQKQGGAWITF